MPVERKAEPPVYTLRRATADDEQFLFELYCTTRADGQVAILAGDGQDAILRMQFVAQRLSYDAQFPTAKHDVIVVDGRAVGRVIVAPQEDEVRFVDLALLPEWRNTGIATVLIRELMDDVARVGKPARLHVAKDNRAIRLYERLGFTVIGESGPSYVMRWVPDTAEREGD
jgi:ribosomal protein S18 acetylase RimI-like enzyme